MKFFKSIVCSIRNEQDECIFLKRNLSFDNDMIQTICNETRLKIFNEAIRILFLCKSGDTINNMFFIKNLQKRIKLHMYQLKKLGTKNYDDNHILFVTLIKFLYKFTLTGKITIGN
jgi:hypothetical protein